MGFLDSAHVSNLVHATRESRLVTSKLGGLEKATSCRGSGLEKMTVDDRIASFVNGP